MQFKVPQNIDMADKIFGPLTMVQFIYVLVGGMTDYILLQLVFPVAPAIFFILAIPIGLLALALAFLKMNDIPFPKFVQAFLLFLVSPKQRIWQKSTEVNAAAAGAEHPTAKPKIIKQRIEKSEIEKIASVLDTAGWSAVRDAQLKTFVQEFDKTHHTIAEQPPNPNSETRNPKQS